MLYPDVGFGITSGPLAVFLRSRLSSWSGLTVAPKRPDPMTKRVLTIRDDGGPPAGTGTVLNRYGLNGWADTAVDAEQLLRDAMAELRTLPGVATFKGTRDFFGPTEIEDDPPFLFGKKPMFHFYASFAAVVKGTQN